MKQIIKVYQDHIAEIEFHTENLTMQWHVYTADFESHSSVQRFSSQAAFALALSIVSFSPETIGWPPSDNNTLGGFLQP